MSKYVLPKDKYINLCFKVEMGSSLLGPLFIIPQWKWQYGKKLSLRIA